MAEVGEPFLTQKLKLILTLTTNACACWGSRKAWSSEAAISWVVRNPGVGSGLPLQVLAIIFLFSIPFFNAKCLLNSLFINRPILEEIRNCKSQSVAKWSNRVIEGLICRFCFHLWSLCKQDWRSWFPWRKLDVRSRFEKAEIVTNASSELQQLN